MNRRLLLASVAAGLASPAFAQRTPSPPGARVYIISPRDGETVSSPFLVQFGLSGMGVAPANFDGGDFTRNTGHHHLLINATLGGHALHEALPADDNHRHFGGGQTEARITLPPGQHTLQLVLADWAHVPHEPPVISERITITVR
jgi:hypothetical protein